MNLRTRIGKAVTPRQAVSLALFVGLCLGAIASAILEHLSWAMAGLAALVGLVFMATVQLRRRMAYDRRATSQQIQAHSGRHTAHLQKVEAETADLAAKVDAMQRRLLAVIETERLTTSERHQELLAILKTSADK